MKIVFVDQIFEIEEFLQFEEIRYSRSLSCNCGHSDYSRKGSYHIVGFVDTPNGYMVVFECLRCREKYRHHIGTTGRYNLESFKSELGLKLHLQHQKGD